MLGVSHPAAILGDTAKDHSKKQTNLANVTENLREAPHLQVGEGQERQLRGVQYPRNCQV